MRCKVSVTFCGSTQSGGMIENYIYDTGLQRTVDGLVKRGGVARAL